MPIMKEIEKWYWAGVKTPNTLNPLDSLSIETILRSREIVGVPLEIVLLKDNATAYTDLKKIYIPSCFFVWEYVEKLIINSIFFDDFHNLSDNEKFLLILSVYNTFFAHEYNHIAHTKYMPEGKNKTWFTIFNIIEDMYINKFSMNGSLGVFFKVFYSLSYSKNFLIEIEDYENNFNSMSDRQFVQYFLAKLLKLNYDYVVYGYDREFEIEVPEHLNNDNKKFELKLAKTKLKKLFSTYDFGDRLKIVEAVYGFLKLFMSKEEIDSETFNPYLDANEAGNKNKFNGFYYDNEVSDKFTDTLNVHKNFDKAFKKISSQENLFNENNFNLAKKIELLSVSDYKIEKEIQIDKQMLAFSHYMRFQWGVTKEKVNAHKNGGKINSKKIHNALSDGKIFRKGREEKDNLVKSQAILLVDLSGSMSGIIESVLSAVYGISYGLMQINYNHSIFGHTCKYVSGYKEYPQLFHIFSWGMSDLTGNIVYNKNLGEAISKTYSVDKTGNEDYIAIKKVSEYFNPVGKKNLFVLSDGRPSPERGGDIGTEATIKSVYNLRKQDINVFSLSLTKEVASQNDKIYGQTNNFHAYGEGLTKSLMQISDMLGKNK